MRTIQFSSIRASQEAKRSRKWHAYQEKTASRNSTSSQKNSHEVSARSSWNGRWLSPLTIRRHRPRVYVLLPRLPSLGLSATVGKGGKWEGKICNILLKAAPRHNGLAIKKTQKQQRWDRRESVLKTPAVAVAALVCSVVSVLDWVE